MHEENHGLKLQVTLIEEVWRMYTKLPANEKALIDPLQSHPFVSLQMPDGKSVYLEPPKTKRIRVMKNNNRQNDNKWTEVTAHVVPVKLDVLTRYQKSELRRRIRNGQTYAASVLVLGMTLKYLLKCRKVTAQKLKPRPDGRDCYLIKVIQKNRFGKLCLVVDNEFSQLQVMFVGSMKHHTAWKKTRKKRATGQTAAVNQPTVMATVEETKIAAVANTSSKESISLKDVYTGNSSVREIDFGSVDTSSVESPDF